MSVAPARTRPARSIPRRRAAHQPVATFPPAESTARTQSRQQHRRYRRRIGLQSEEDEEHGGEQITQRSEHLPSDLRHGAHQCDPDEERPDRSRDLQLLGQPRHQQRDPEHAQQERLPLRRAVRAGM